MKYCLYFKNLIFLSQALQNESSWYHVTSSLLGSVEKTTLFRLQIGVTLSDGDASQEVREERKMSERMKLFLC